LGALGLEPANAVADRSQQAKVFVNNDDCVKPTIEFPVRRQSPLRPQESRLRSKWRAIHYGHRSPLARTVAPQLTCPPGTTLQSSAHFQGSAGQHERIKTDAVTIDGKQELLLVQFALIGR
jgi:hypothetical protein